MPKLTVIGAGVSGQGLAMLAHTLGEKVLVSEQKNIPDDVKTLFTQNDIAYEEGHSEKVFEDTREILISSGIPPKSEILREAEKRGFTLTGELDYVLPHIRTNNLHSSAIYSPKQASKQAQAAISAHHRPSSRRKILTQWC